MPANIAEGKNGTHRAAYVNTPAWHKLGKVISAQAQREGVKWPVIYKEAQLDYPLKLIPAGGKLGRKWIEDAAGRKAIIRPDLDPPPIFGYVTNRYELILNKAVGEVLDALVEEHAASYVSAFALGQGERVGIVMRLDQIKGLQIKGDPSKYGAYLFGTTRHDGTGALQIGRAVQRLECQNMLDMGIARAEATGKIVSIRHTGDPEAKLKEARDILGFVNRFVEEFTVLGNRLADEPLPKGFVADFLSELIPIPEEMERTGSREEAREAIASLYRESKTLVGVPGTAYRLVQAVTEYADHYRPIRGSAEKFAEARFKSAIEGPGHDLKQTGLDLIVQKLEIDVPKLVAASRN